jgi:hypothetical protein
MNEEENAAELNFGNEFSFSGANNVQCLTNDEVYFFLSDRRKFAAGAKSEYECFAE